MRTSLRFCRGLCRSLKKYRVSSPHSKNLLLKFHSVNSKGGRGGKTYFWVNFLHSVRGVNGVSETVIPLFLHRIDI